MKKTLFRGRGRFRERDSGKKSPEKSESYENTLKIPQLVIRPDGDSNYFEWSKKYANAMEREYNDFGKFPTTGKLELPREPTIPDYLLIPNDATVNQLAEITRNNKIKQDVYTDGMKS